MLPAFTAQASEQARALLDEAVEQYRQQLALRAQQSSSDQQRFALLVRHGLVRSQGADSHVEQQLRRILELQYGVGGEFDINLLLNLYR